MTSGQSGRGTFGQTVQLEIERRIEFLADGCAQLGDLGLEFLPRGGADVLLRE